MLIQSFGIIRAKIKTMFRKQIAKPGLNIIRLGDCRAEKEDANMKRLSKALNLATNAVT